MVPGAESDELEDVVAVSPVSVGASSMNAGAVVASVESSMADVWLTVASAGFSVANEDGGAGPGSVSLGISTRGVPLERWSVRVV